MITVEEARAYYQGAEAAHDFDHVLRVMRLAERIALAEGADVEIVRAAALLHDVARADEARGGPPHAAAGAARARVILAGHPPERVEAVAEAIASHRFRERRAPRTLEAQVLYDADKLDAIGAIGVARAYAVAGREGQRLWAEVPPDYVERPVSSLEENAAPCHTPCHEYVYKLSHLKDMLYTPTARRLAEERHAYMAAFFERLDREVRGEI